MSISIQENMNYLAELEAKYPQYKYIIDKTADMITWLGVQPELEALMFNNKACIMLWWNYKEEAYLAYYISDSDYILIEDADEEGEMITELKMSFDEAINYYNVEWHNRLIIFDYFLICPFTASLFIFK